MSTPKGDGANLATVRDYYPALTENQRNALAKWNAFEQIVNAPFVPNEDGARKGIVFTVLRLGEGSFDDLNDVGAKIEKWLVFARLLGAYTLRYRGGQEVSFAKDQLVKISFPKGEGLRDDTARVIAQIIAESGELPAMTLRQLPPKQKGHSGAIVLSSIYSE